MQRRKQGEKPPIGSTKKKIVLLILDSYPMGIEESDIREVLRSEDNIRDSKGIKKHLATLKNEGIIEKDSEGVGKANVWHVRPDLETFKKIAFEFLDSSERFDFVKTPYVQNMINIRLLNYFSKDWIRVIKGDLTADSVSYSDLEQLLIRQTNLIEMLKNSPTALRIFCFGSKEFKNFDDIFIRLKYILLNSFVTDQLMSHMPEGNGLYAEIKLRYVETYEEDGKIKEKELLNFPWDNALKFIIGDTKIQREWKRA